MKYKEKVTKLQDELILSMGVLREKLESFLDTEADIDLGDHHVINLKGEDVQQLFKMEKDVIQKIESLEYIIRYLPDKNEPVVEEAVKILAGCRGILETLNLNENLAMGHIHKVDDKNSK